MYDPLTGRCFDGITDSATINRNSGAESTIEALYTLVELRRYPEALRYYEAKRIAAGHDRGTPYAFFEDPEGNHLLLMCSTSHSPVTIMEGTAAEQRMNLLRGGGQ
jgi:hypothetical protein